MRSTGGNGLIYVGAQSLLVGKETEVPRLEIQKNFLD